MELEDGEAVVMHSQSAIAHYPASHFRQALDHEQDYSQTRTVLRGFAELDKVENGEHLERVRQSVLERYIVYTMYSRRHVPIDKCYSVYYM